MKILKELKLNGEPLQPIGLQWAGYRHQMGSTSDGKYNEFARMALSHPVLPSQPPAVGSMTQISGSHSKIYEHRASNAHKNLHRNRQNRSLSLIHI